MNQGALTLFRLAGITVRLHYTWFLAFILVAWSLGRGIFPFGYPGWSELNFWLAGSAAALLLFASVLFHEFAHSFMALSRGLKVDSITLFIFGGAAALKSEPKRPSDEFFIAVVGPASSLFLAVVFFTLSSVLPVDLPAQRLAFFLGGMNAVLAVFNLLPGFPLDGGRVFRALVWAITGSMRKGTTVASLVGQVFAFGFIALGIYILFNGSFLGGVWLVFIGWFLNGAAAANRRNVTQEEALRQIPVSRLMRAKPEEVRPDETIDRVVLALLLHDGLRALPVMLGGRVIGIISADDVRRVPQHAWSQQTVFWRTMTPSPLVTVAPKDSILHAMDLFEEHEAQHVIVMDGADVAGILSLRELARFCSFPASLASRPRSAGARTQKRPPLLLPANRAGSAMRGLSPQS